MIILGLNYNHPDSSACLIKDGKILSAVDEERFVRIKHYSGLPLNSIEYCLKNANIKISDIDYVALNFNPNANFNKKISYAIKNIFKLSTIKKILNFKNKFKNKNKLNLFLKNNNFNGEIINVEHHLSHLSSSFYLSNFESSIGLTIDGFGDFCSMEAFLCETNKIISIKKILFPHSLGIFYQAITQYLGFKNYGDEYKVMGLASYGNPIYLKEFEKIINYSDKNFFELNLKYFSHHDDKNFKYSFENGIPIFNNLYSSELITMFGKERDINENISQHHKDIAASMQTCFENIVIKILNKLYDKFQIENLCLSGGCAFNSKLNGIIKERTKFKNIFIQPNAGDGGGSLGAALQVNSIYNKNNKTVSESDVYLGPNFTNQEIEKMIKSRSDLDEFKIKKFSDDEIYNSTANKIASNLIVGWFKGRMEWGPRALGNRSILANPKNKEIKDILNLKIKLREKFRPFAPAILYEFRENFFYLDYHSPFMLNVVDAKDLAKNTIPSVVHVDNTCRVQTVKRNENLHFYNLIKKFYDLTNIPVLLNTSFNENEPIVLSPSHAIDCFIRTRMDYLVLENWTISR